MSPWSQQLKKNAALRLSAADVMGNQLGRTLTCLTFTRATA
jgi:hypothetical protein